MSASEIDLWPVAKQTAYHQAGLQAAINAAIRQAEADYRAKHPQAGALKTTGEVRVYRKPPKGFYSHPVEMVELMLESRLALAEPNSAFIARLQAKFSPYAVPRNLLTRPLTDGPSKAIKKLLDRKGVKLDLRRHNTLSKIKLALRARAAGEGGATAYDVRLTFTDCAVIAGDRTFPVHLHKAGYRRIKVGEDKLRVDVLEELARAAT